MTIPKPPSSKETFRLHNKNYFATNGFFFFLQVKVTILDKNDSPPSFKDTPLKYTVSEDLSPGQSVATIKAEDPDTLGNLEYTLISGDDGHFALDSASGVLQLIDSVDRESKDIYKLTIRASDGIQHSDSVITIQVRENYYFIRI